MKKIALFEHPLPVTPVTKLNAKIAGNTVYVKRDDLLPFALGGNKVRKASEFYHVIREAGADVIMTYGTAQSNHCRVIALMASAMGVRCHVISPVDAVAVTEPVEVPAARPGSHPISFNERIVRETGATIEFAPLDHIPEAIAHRETAYRQEGLRPYFIKGGGHGLPGTLSYVKAYAEILKQERAQGFAFDKIFLASGTGCTQAGLVCGELIDNATTGVKKRTSRIVGISIARKNPNGRDVVVQAVTDFMEQCPEIPYPKLTDKNLIFDDTYIAGGYGKTTPEMTAMITDLLVHEGIPLDTTYTGKAFYGMTRYLAEHRIRGKKILFLHTGGTPIAFDDMNRSL